MRTTQRQNILRHLLRGPLCGVHDDWTMGRRIAARIHELRSVGFNIGKKECTHNHHRSRQIMYQLYGDDTPNWCAYCGPLGDFRGVAGVGDELSDGLELVRCDRCGKKDYR